MSLGLRARLAIAIALVFFVGAVVAGWVLRDSYLNSIQAAAEAALLRAQATFNQTQSDETDKLSSTLNAIEADPRYRNAFVARDRKALLATAAPVFARLRSDHRITHWYFESEAPSSTVFLRVHAPEQYGDVLQRKTYMKATSSGGEAAGLELGKTAVALRVVRPYVDESGEIIGYLELGEEIDQFLTKVKAQTGDDVALLLAKDGLDRQAWSEYRAQEGERDNWDDRNRYVVAGLTREELTEDIAFDEALTVVPREGLIIAADAEDKGRHETLGLFPVIDAGGDAIGLVFVEHDITAQVEELRSAQLRVLAVMLGMMLVALLVVIALVNRFVIGRLDAIIVHLEELGTRVVGGDFGIVYEHSGPNDELSRFEDFIGHFIEMIASTLKEMAERTRRR